MTKDSELEGLMDNRGKSKDTLGSLASGMLGSDKAKTDKPDYDSKKRDYPDKVIERFVPQKTEVDLNALLNEENESRKLCYGVSCTSRKKKVVKEESDSEE